MEKKRKQLKRKCVVTNGEKEGRKMSSQGGGGVERHEAAKSDACVQFRVKSDITCTEHYSRLKNRKI